MEPEKRERNTTRNLEFIRRLIARRPALRTKYEPLLRPLALESPAARIERAIDLESIVDAERPVLFVNGDEIDVSDDETRGPEARELVAELRTAAPRLHPLLPLIGRIDVANFPGSEFVGTGWFVAEDVVVTNRHVASLIAKWDGRKFDFTRGTGGRTIESSLCNAHEFDDPDPAAERIFRITEVLYIEAENRPNDIAFVRVARRATGTVPKFIPIATADAVLDLPVCTVGYPARASRRVIPDQELMERMYRGKYDIKRAAPGLGLGTRRGLTEHDCTTLGGNSGSVVLDLQGRAVGLHFAGLYQEANYAVRASTLNEYIRGERWRQPFPVRELRDPVQPPASPPPALAVAPISSSVSVTIPLTITISLGNPVGGSTATTRAAGPPTVPQAEEAVRQYWESRPQHVLAARVGFEEENGRIGDTPFVAVSVLPEQLGAVRTAGPSLINGVPIRYFPADALEQVEAMPEFEAAEEIAYDDDARTGEDFSFASVDEEMEMTLHVGPEYSWDVLKEFLDGTPGSLVASMYEFHALHIQEAIEARLEAGAKVKLVLDNKTFGGFDGDSEEFDRVVVFERWADRFSFSRIVAPGGRRGLMANSYHTKVAVRNDGVFWHSSGNWKPGSSQPKITQAQRDNATDEDLPGNREWHVVIRNRKLADRFRNHILQDFERSKELGGREVPRSLIDETVLLIPEEETFALERRAPSRILEPKRVQKRVKIKPLMTPDREGEVYCEAVLDLIRSAERSLLFQIPYIGMPPSRSDRGYIDALIRALTDKLKTLDDARVILRTGSSALSSPTHAAWYFKSKGVDIANRLRVIEDSHTKGMIVDGERALVGSHNWSKSGVTLNRDASLIFHDEVVAAYYAEAFEIDWQRSNPIRPRRFVGESAITEAAGAVAPTAFKRVRLGDLLSDN